MAKKIKGWAWPDTDEKDVERTGFPIYNQKVDGTTQATLVITDERVFTESGIKSILMRFAHVVEQHTGTWVSPKKIDF